jgi:hypothetical protein
VLTNRDRHQREEPLGVRLASHQRAVGAEPPVELIEVRDDPVVGKNAAVEAEGMRVGLRHLAVVRVADMGPNSP